MPGKGGDYGNKAVNAIAGAAAAFVARKLIVFAWTKITGKEPPLSAEDPKVAIGEAVAWALVAGAGVGVARVLAVRIATHQTSKRLAESTDVDA